jgi:hypothetical protein
MTGAGLRPATPADSEFCFRLHKAAMGGYITAIWGWDEQRQRDFHTREFNPGRWQIITAVTVGHADGRDLVDIALFEALAPVPRDLNIHVSAATPMLTSARRD